MRLTAFALIALLAACTPPGGEQVSGRTPAKPTVQTFSTDCAAEKGKCDTFFFRVRFWEMSSFSANLQRQILAVAEQESNRTYNQKPGAVSRDLGDPMVAEWQKGTAKTIAVAISGRAIVPGMEGWQNFAAMPGSNPTNPKETYVEWKLSRAAVRSLSNPIFRAEIPNIPAGCQIVYWKTRYLESRGNDSGENEVHRMVETKLPGFNLNFVLACTAKRSA